MNENIFQLSMEEVGIAAVVGAVCSLIYLYLLWRTVQILPKVKRKGFFLFSSMVIRIFFILAVMKLFAGEHAGKFLISACSFIVARLFVLRFGKFGAYNREEDKQLQKAMGKKKK